MDTVLKRTIKSGTGLDADGEESVVGQTQAGDRDRVEVVQSQGEERHGEDQLGGVGDDQGGGDVEAAGLEVQADAAGLDEVAAAPVHDHPRVHHGVDGRQHPSRFNQNCATRLDKEQQRLTRKDTVCISGVFCYISLWVIWWTKSSRAEGSVPQ